ncbi:DUF5320 domain-containing protein [Candidatus Pacearchaeota archaeon]|nr:DUF5320 domain-containing protein [Candidatus Pacearchaeota archaeon]
MPRGDKTGPEGKGPKTGRQMGNCEGAKPIAGRGRGLGRGFRNRRYNPSSEEEIKDLESEKAAIEKRLEELK